MDKPRKSPWYQQWSVNTHISDIILNLLNNLKNKPENKWKDQFQVLKDFLEYYSIDGNNSLLEELSKTWTISFDMIKDDGFTIDEIIWEDKDTSGGTLHNILNSSQLWKIGKDIEKIVIEEFVKKTREKIPSWLQANFDNELRNISTLNDFKSKMWDFFEFGENGNDRKIDENIKNEIIKVKITNKDIIEALVAYWSLQANDIVGDYKNWNTEHKKVFDKIITQEYLWWLKNSANYLEKNFNMMKDTFVNFIPNMSWILDKYPYEIDKVDKELLQKIDDAQESWNKEESDRLSFQAYISLVKNKNAGLWNILSQLFQEKFDFSKLEKKEQNELVKEMLNGKLEELKKSWIAWLLEVDQSDLDKFVRDIFDLNKNEIIIPCAGWNIALGVNKQFVPWEHPHFSDFSNLSDTKLPLSFDIKILGENKDIINNSALKKVFASEISQDWNSIQLDAWNIGKLLLMYSLWTWSFDKKEMNPEKINKLKNIIDLMGAKNNLQENSENKEKDQDFIEEVWEGKRWESENPEEDSQWKEKQENPFYDTWKNFRWYSFPENKENFWFVKWTRLWVKRADTELPPLDIWWDQWIQLEIKSISKNSFKVKLTWWELSAWGLEGKEFSYPKTKESLEIISKALDGEIYKLPNPEKWKETIEHIKWAGISGIDGISVFDELELKSWKLQSNIIEWNPEITHFGSMETKIDEKSWLEKKEIINYEVKFNNNWTVDVSYNNYKRSMDYNNFLLFVSTKRLKPKTKDEIDQENKIDEKWPTHTWSKWKFFGVANIWHMVQWVWKKVNEWMKKYNEKQDKKFYNVAMWDWKLANKLNWVIWWIPGVGWALEDMNTDFENNKDKETREKTEEILKKIEAHNDFWAIFTDKTHFNSLLWSGISLRDMVVSGNLPWWLSGDKRFVASALLLAQIDKWPWPYEKIEWLRFKWPWVKLILWEPYYSKFMEQQKEIIAEMKAKQWLYGPWYDAQLASDLARAEMTFLINNIWWRAPWQRLWNIETGALKWLDGNAKKIWSDQFAWKIEERFNAYMSRTKVEEWADKLANVNNFTFAYIEYRRFLEAGKPTKALPFLKKMAQLAKSPDQIKRFKWAISYGMLTWFLLHHTLPWTQVRVQNICRSFGFSPWLRAPHIDHQKKLAHFFDIAWRDSSGKSDFYKETWYKLSDFDHVSKFDYKKFIEGEKWWAKWFEKRWDNHADLVDKFLNEWMYKEDMNDPIIKQLQEASMESQQEDIDQDVSKNSKLISNYPLSLTKWVISQISRYDNWSFTWKDNDEVQRSQDAWTAISKKIPKWPVDKWRLVYTTKRFLNRFDDTFDWSSKEELVKVLATVKKYKKMIREGWGEIPQEFEWKTMWYIRDTDIKNILRFMTSWKIFNRKSAPPQEYKSAIEAFEKMFWDNLDSIDENFIEQTFGSENVKYFYEKDSFQLVPRNVYSRMTEIWTSQLNDYEKRFKNRYLELNNKWVFINRSMKNVYDSLSRKISCPTLGWEVEQNEKIEWFS